MLNTTFGGISIFLDGSPLEYQYHQLATGVRFPDLNGRYGVIIELKPDGKDHILGCRIDNFVSNSIQFDNDRKIKIASFYSEQGIISLGIVKGVELFGIGDWFDCYFDFDAGLYDNGICYHIECLSRTTQLYFGISWTDNFISSAVFQSKEGANPKYWSYKCPCCGYFTLGERPNGTFDICPVCFWEDDGVQLDNPDFSGGANTVSLYQGRENFLKYGACEKEMVPHVRKPVEDEFIGIDWENI